MALPDLGSLPRRVLIFGMLAPVLLTTPLWAPALSLGEPSYEYNRTEVTTTDTELELADDRSNRPQFPISEHIECAYSDGVFDIRACSFEEHLLEKGSVPTEGYTTNPNYTTRQRHHFDSADYYRYVQLDGVIYEPSYVVNTSAAPDSRDRYRIDMTLEPVDPDTVLDHVSIDVSSGSLPSTVAETAQRGPTTTRGEVDVPDTPIKLDDDTYYRVYQESGPDDPWGGEDFQSDVLTYIAPMLGVVICIRLSHEIEVSYVGDDG